jgi:succinoglycan biosynthesis protein ExoM
MTRVAICIATFRRPLGLTRLVQGIDALTLPGAAAGDGITLEVVVVDNDPQGGAAPVCRALEPECRWPLRYLHEPRRGIAQARNRAVDAVSGRVNFLAFIDDDEVPDANWLTELLRVQREYEADVVAGPVVPVFEGEAAPWILDGRFFDRPRHETGHALRLASTGNALIRSSLLTDPAMRFDERLGLTGGEDAHFFARVHAAGHRMIWADDAVVRESIPATRARARWLLQRAYRSGNSWSLCEYDLYPTLATRATRIAKGIGRVGQGALSLPLTLVSGRRGLVKALQNVFLGAGAVTGALGVRYEEYRKVHGR